MDDPESMMTKCILNVCKAGNELLCAGYCLYSSSTVLVLTIGNGVYGFTFDPLVSLRSSLNLLVAALHRPLFQGALASNPGQGDERTCITALGTRGPAPAPAL